MARARRPEGITEDEHRVLHGELEDAGAIGGPWAVAAVVVPRPDRRTQWWPRGRPVRDPGPRL